MRQVSFGNLLVREQDSARVHLSSLAQALIAYAAVKAVLALLAAAQGFSPASVATWDISTLRSVAM